MIVRVRWTGPIAVMLALSLVPLPTLADPPPWAPANGWRRHHERDYHERDYHERDYERYPAPDEHRYRAAVPADYGVLQGRCDTSALGAVVGGVAGAAVGSQFGQGNGRTASTILGAAIGAIIGSHLGQQIDATDRACMGETLEFASPNQMVVWTNPQTNVRYRMTPTRRFIRDGEQCRDFVEHVSAGARYHTIRGVACRRSDGHWRYER